MWFNFTLHPVPRVENPMHSRLHRKEKDMPPLLPKEESPILLPRNREETNTLRMVEIPHMSHRVGSHPTLSKVGSHPIPSTVGNRPTPSRVGNNRIPSKVGNHLTPRRLGISTLLTVGNLLTPVMYRCLRTGLLLGAEDTLPV